MKNLFFFFLIFVLLFPTPVFAGPSSSNYELVEFGFGAGSTASSSSTNYSLNGVLGEQTASQSSSNYTVQSGLNLTMQANVPPAPTFTNPSNYYNKLKLVITTGNNPTDAKYAIAISSDAFGLDTKYVQTDNTIASTLGPEDWQSYATWGGASGFEIIGLAPNTTYTVKVAAMQGSFTQTGFGPTAQAATDNPSISFDIDVSATDSETAAPYTLSFGSVTIGSVTTASEKIWIDFSTNALSGGYIYVASQNAGLRSTALSRTISSATTNLSSASEGFGIQSNSATQTAGGPFLPVSPYNNSSENVGVVDTTIREVYSSSSSPITNGRASFSLKVKTSPTTPAASDYSDTFTLIASATF